VPTPGLAPRAKTIAAASRLVQRQSQTLP